MIVQAVLLSIFQFYTFSMPSKIIEIVFTRLCFGLKICLGPPHFYPHFNPRLKARAKINLMIFKGSHGFKGEHKGRQSSLTESREN